MAESARLRYLVLRGTLYPDNRFVLRSSHLTDDGNAYRGEAQSRVVAELVDEQGSTLVRHGVPIVHPCDGAGPADSATVRGAVPLHPGTRLVRLTRDGLLIHELVVSRRERGSRKRWSISTSCPGATTATLPWWRATECAKRCPRPAGFVFPSSRARPSSRSRKRRRLPTAAATARPGRVPGGHRSRAP